MQEAADVPITVKTRVGIDDKDSDDFFARFIDTVAAAGCRKFIVHARIAILEGLSPKENRSIPPLNYERVFRLKKARPELEIVLNGGVSSVEQVGECLDRVDGVMIGRKAYHDPFFLAELERHFDASRPLPCRRDIVKQMLPYLEAELGAGEKLGRMTRHMVGLFAGQPGARAWRRRLAENAYRPGAGIEVVLDALDAVPVAA
jgi:tRNA-dihydrouridine synthase A